MTERRRIAVDLLSRVEGRGALRLEVADGAVQDVRLEIYEPPRFFESLAVGRSAAELPDLLARICGICPVAYQMSAVHALESIYQVAIEPGIRALRRLYYCGEWIESHVLHMAFLAAPDYLGCEDAATLAGRHPEPIQQAIRLRRVGNRILSLLGGRPVNPVGACIGGFTRVPTRMALDALAEALRAARPDAEGLLGFFAGLAVDPRPQPMEVVSLRHPAEYPMNEGRIASSTGLDIPVADFDAHFAQSQVPHSTALHCRIRGRGSYLVGPLARVLLNAARFPAPIQAALEALSPRLPATDPAAGVFARGIEVLYAIDEAIRMIEAFEPPRRPAAEWAPRAGVGHAATEAPRGLLYVRVETDGRGDVRALRIVPPTAQNQARIEEDLRLLAPELLSLGEEEARRRCERAIRDYDPCISCSAHFLDLVIERGGGPS
jgi:sulfhydrogenase subunit alpha